MDKLTKRATVILDEGYGLVLLSLVNFILTPSFIGLFNVPPVVISVINYSFIIFASVSICKGKGISFVYYVLGIIALTITWLDIYVPGTRLLEVTKLIGLFIIFAVLFVMLLRNLIQLDSSKLQEILGAISGFIFWGLIGGTILEVIGYYNDIAFKGITHHNTFSYIYFSFSSITTVGFGDIVPVTLVARSLTILMSILGQFYLAVVVALFVGRYLSEKINYARSL